MQGKFGRPGGPFPKMDRHFLDVPGKTDTLVKKIDLEGETVEGHEPGQFDPVENPPCPGEAKARRQVVEVRGFQDPTGDPVSPVA